MIDSIIDRVREWVRDSTVRTDEPNILRRLGVADYLSLGALFWGLVSALLFVEGEPNWAIVAMLGAYAFDKLDGFVARKLDETSKLGLKIDSYIDVFTYLVPAALLFHVALAPNVYVSAVVGFLVLGFGGLRLIRHASEGLGTEGDVDYYRGITVVHTNLAVVGAYFVDAFAPRYLRGWDGALWGWVAGVAVAAVCPLMVSDYKSYKTDLGHGLAAAAGLVAAGLALLLEYGLP